MRPIRAVRLAIAVTVLIVGGVRRYQKTHATPNTPEIAATTR